MTETRVCVQWAWAAEGGRWYDAVQKSLLIKGQSNERYWLSLSLSWEICYVMMTAAAELVNWSTEISIK